MKATPIPRPPRARPVPVVLTIAGSDSGGGAGIQADLKAFRARGAFGTSAITCLTAQTPEGVRGLEAVAPAMVALQIRAVCAGFPVAAAKTGMLYSAAIIAAVAETVRRCRIPALVVDPVMVATSGARLLREDAIDALCRRLLPRATVVTPNLPEAEVLWGRPIRSAADLATAARAIGERFGTACVVKGGHLAGGDVIDVLYDGRRMVVYRSRRVRVAETHGTGCTFSAALAAGLALGEELGAATAAAKRLVGAALRRARPAGRHRPLWV